MVAVAVMDLKERLKCGYQESDGGGCDRDPWHGLLYVTNKETQGAEFISSVALVHLADQNPIIIAGGTILSKARQDLEQVVKYLIFIIKSFHWLSRVMRLR